MAQSPAEQTLTDADVERSHLIADYELTRTHSLRTIRNQTDLLTDAMHALRNGSTATAGEFIERVRDELDAEARYLRNRSITAIIPD